MHDNAEGIAALAGAYVLLAGLIRLRHLDLRGKRRLRLAAGWYAYCGSANGSGGLKARIKRHFKPIKPYHWHIDCLTNGDSDLAALPQPDAEECTLVKRLISSDLFTIGAARFGNTDCQHCKSHLLRWNGA